MIEVYGNESCDECAKVKHDLSGMGVSYKELDAQALFDLPIDPDIISDIIAASKGRLPFLKLGKRVFAIVGEINE